MTPPTIVFGREKKFRLGGTSFPTLEDFFLGPGSRTKYTYDAWNRMVQVSNSSTTVNYEYDGENRLVERQSCGTTDYYFYAGSQVVETRETTSAQSATSAPVL